MASSFESPSLRIQSGPNESLLKRLRSLNAKWLRIYWADPSSASKCRLIPMKQVYKTLDEGKEVKVAITKASLGLLQLDTMIPGVTATGVYELHPDWSSLRPGPAPDHVSCYGDFRELDGGDCVFCPRTILRKTLKSAAANGLSFLVGFEIEFVAMERNADGPEKYRAVRHDGHAWSSSRVLADWGRDGTLNAALDEMVDVLDVAGIAVEQFHAESSPGQYEIVLPAMEPLAVCDALLHARQIIESAAARHGFRVTLHPKPWAHACGTAAHAHISVRSSDNDHVTPSQIYESFYAGILSHFRAISAFTMPSPASYERALDGCWAGGRWVSWGLQNRETPLRKIEGSHWEFKALDGMANPFLAMAAILAAGTKGIVDKTPLTWRDCQVDPASLGSERKELGITEMLPQSLTEALKALSADQDLANLLHPAAVQRYVELKKAELDFLEPMNPEERRQWLIERF